MSVDQIFEALSSAPRPSEKCVRGCAPLRKESTQAACTGLQMNKMEVRPRLGGWWAILPH